MTKYNYLVGSYSYIMTFVKSGNIESQPTSLFTSYTYSDTNYLIYNELYIISNVVLNINVSNDNTVISRNIYRTKREMPNKFYLLATINDNTTLTFFDNINDSSLLNLYNNPYNDSILSTNINNSSNTLNFNVPFSLSTISTTDINTLDVGYYYYTFSYFNTSSFAESTKCNNVKIRCSNNEYVKLIILQTINNLYYDSYKIYRTKIQNNTSTDSKFYLLDTILKSEVEYIDIRYNNKPEINYISPLPITINLNETRNNNLSGTYRYIMTFYFAGQSIESHPPNKYLQVTYDINSKLGIKLNISPNNLVTLRKIYRTRSNLPDLYYLLDIINDNTTTTFFDNINDSNLTELYNNPYNNDNILKDKINDNYLNITTQINNNLINKITYFILSEIPNQNNKLGGTYQYVFTYYNIDTYEESIISDKTIVKISNKSSINIKFEYRNQQYINIYRTNVDDNKFLYLYQVNLDDTLSYNDELDILSSTPLSYISQNIIRPNISNISYKIIDYEFIKKASLLSVKQKLYKYKFSYYNSITFEESVLSDTLNIISYYSIGSNQELLLYIDLFFYNYDLPDSYYIKIYRNKTPELSIYDTASFINDDQNYIFIDKIHKSIDTFRDSIIIPSNYVTTYINNFTNYYLLEVPISNIAPNLDSFNSHSTDTDFINNKGLSDFNDFLFNKSFIMLSNNNETASFDNNFNLLTAFNKPMLYFYNINFKLNETSIITLNNKPVVFILPISTQQFFIKDQSATYYKINNGNIIDSTSSVEQYTFNPSFDAFNIPIDFLLSSNYSLMLIDQMSYIVDYQLQQNSDYNTIVNAIENINNIFVNQIIKTLDQSNNIFGNMSKMILSSIDKLNKLFNVFNNNDVILPIMNYSNQDYFNFSHNVLRYIDDPISLSSNSYNLVACFNKDKFKILSPVFTKYSSSNKISTNLYNYLLDVVTFYKDQLKYIDNNIDYLNLTNPNQYQEEYISNTEIIQNINNNIYDYSKSTQVQINLLHPIIDIDTQIFQIIINNTIITEAVITDSNTITTNQYLENKSKDNNYESKNININKYSYSDEKFNYFGILSIDSNNNIISQDYYSDNNGNVRYIMSENNNIYTITFESTLNRYKINNLINGIIFNPVEIINLVNNTVLDIKVDNIAPNSTQLDQQITYLYIYNITFISSPDFSVSTGIILFINNLTFFCSLEQINTSTFTFIILTNVVLE
jgi:hypothetical protein